jgi:hypothetical protein
MPFGLGGIEEHIEAMKAFVESVGATPPKVVSHPIAFGSGEGPASSASSKTGAAW